MFGCVGEGLQGLTFQTKSPPLQPMDIMPYIYSHASEGDAEAVIKAIDEFGELSHVRTHPPSHPQRGEPSSSLLGFVLPWLTLCRSPSSLR